MTTTRVQNHDVLAQRFHYALAESELLPEQHGLSNFEGYDEEKGIVSVHHSATLFNYFAVLEELPASEVSLPLMNLSENSVQRKRRPTRLIHVR